MRIAHHIALRIDERRRSAFRGVGIEVEPGHASFSIFEDDPRWPVVSRLTTLYEAGDIPTARFDASELNRAKYLAMLPRWHHGYPEPVDGNLYMTETYDLSDYCRRCGCGWKQRAPFRLARSPRWGKHSVLQLNWIVDEYFVRPEVWAEVFNPIGVSCIPVVLNRSGKAIDSMVQLDLPTIADLQMPGLEGDTCFTCGRFKYSFPERGFIPKPIGSCPDIFRSTQYFGSGASGFRLVIVSQKLYRVAMDKLRGVEFAPCCD